MTAAAAPAVRRITAASPEGQRFRAERQRPVQSPAAEARAATVVAIALGVISAVLLVQSAAELASDHARERPR